MRLSQLGSLPGQLGQRIDDRGGLPLAHVNLGKQKQRFRIIRVQRRRLVEAGRGLRQVLVAEVRHGQLVFNLRRSRIDGAHPLEFRDCFGGLAFDQLQATIEQEDVVIERVLREDLFDQLFAVVEFSLGESYVGQPGPCGDVVRGFLRDFFQQLPGSLEVAGLNLEIGVSQPSG